MSRGRDPRAILDDREGRRSVSFQEAVEAIAAVVAPDRADELGHLAEQSPNRVRRVLDDLLDRHPVDSGTEEKVLRVAWAYGELRFVRSLARQASPRARSRAEAWARARLEARRERRRREREAGAWRTAPTRTWWRGWSRELAHAWPGRSSPRASWTPTATTCTEARRAS